MHGSANFPRTAATRGLVAALFFSAYLGGCVQADAPAVADVRHGSVVVDGALLHYTVEGSGHPCLVVGSRTFHRQMFSARFKEHFRCSFTDTRMFAPGATAPPGRPYDLTALVEDVEAVRHDLGWDRLIVVGHSLFAWVALEYARAHPERTDGVVMIAMSPKLPGVAAMEDHMEADASAHRRAVHAQQQQRWEAWLNEEERSADEQLLQYFVTHSAVYWYDPEFDSAALWEDVLWDAGLFNEVVANSVDYDVAAGPRVNAPVFVAHGRYDYRVPYTLWDDEARAAIERLSFHLFQESGHQPPLEEPDAFDREVIGWLDALPSGSADHPFIEHVLSSDIAWRTVTTEHFIVHGVVDSYAGDHLTSLGELAEQAREFVLGRIGAADTGAQPGTHVFLVRGPDDLRALVGQPAGGWTEPAANAVLAAVGEEAPPALRHELGHLFSHRLWGRPHGAWLSEGVAVYAVGHCAGIPLHQWAAAIQRAGEPASLGLLQREFDFTRAAPHLLAGSFVTFVVDRYGVEAVEMLWQRGLEPTQRALDANGIDLEAEWHATLRDTEISQGLPDFRGRVRCENGT